MIKTRSIRSLLALALLLSLALLLFTACGEGESYRNDLGATYTFSGKTFTHTDSLGHTSKGKFKLEGDLITFTYQDGSTLTLPYSAGDGVIYIGDMPYRRVE